MFLIAFIIPPIINKPDIKSKIPKKSEIPIFISNALINFDIIYLMFWLLVFPYSCLNNQKSLLLIVEYYFDYHFDYYFIFL